MMFKWTAREEIEAIYPGEDDLVKALIREEKEVAALSQRRPTFRGKPWYEVIG